MQKYITLAGGSGSGTFRLVVYYFQRIVTNRRLRQIGTWLLLGLFGRFSKHGRRSRNNSEAAQVLRKIGYLSLGQVLTQQQCDDIHTYLSDKLMLDNRGTGARFNLLDRPESAKLGDYELETVVACPHVMSLANGADLIDLATDYLGFTPTITNVSLRWSFPTDMPAGEVQSFHRDAETGSFKVLVYLTEVDLSSGAHVYVCESHHDRMPFRLRIYSDEEVAKRDQTQIVVMGGAGSAFAIDSKGIHKGMPPVTRPHLVLGIQFSLLPCLLYDYAPVPINVVALDSYVNRLIVKIIE